MAVLSGAPAHDLVSPESLSFDEIVRGTGRAAEIGLGAGLAPSVTLLPRRRSITSPRDRNLPGMVLYHFGNFVTTVAFALFLFLAVGPHLFPYQPMTMLTGSMVPTINPGDIAVDTRISVYRLEPGDIITYHIPVDDHRVVSHRIISVTPEVDGSVTVQTKGDANESNDPWTANFNGGTVWQVRTVLPKLGMGIRFFREPKVAAASVYVAPVIAAALALAIIWTPRKRVRTEPDPHDVQFRESPFAPPGGRP